MHTVNKMPATSTPSILPRTGSISQSNGTVKSTKLKQNSLSQISNASGASTVKKSQSNGHVTNGISSKKDEVRRVSKEIKPVEKDILKRHAKDPASLILHLHPTRFKFEHQDGFFAYKSQLRDFLKYIKEQRLPPDLTDVFDAANCRYYSGCLIVEIHDHRTKSEDLNEVHPANSQPSSSEPKRSPVNVKRVLLRPTAETLWTEVCLINEEYNGMITNEMALELEAKILLATEEPLCLDPSVQVTRLSNAINYARSPQKNKKKRKWNSTEREEELAKKVESDRLMTMMDERAQRAYPFQPSFGKLSFMQDWREIRRKREADIMPSVEVKKIKGRKQPLIESLNISEGRKCVRTLRFERKRGDGKIFTILNIYTQNNEYDGVLRWGTTYDTSIEGDTLEFKIGPEYIYQQFIMSFLSAYKIHNQMTGDNNSLVPQTPVATRAQPQIPHNLPLAQQQITQVTQQPASTTNASSSSAVQQASQMTPIQLPAQVTHSPVIQTVNGLSPVTSQHTTVPAISSAVLNSLPTQSLNIPISQQSTPPSNPATIPTANGGSINLLNIGTQPNQSNLIVPGMFNIPHLPIAGNNARPPQILNSSIFTNNPNNPNNLPQIPQSQQVPMRTANMTQQFLSSIPQSTAQIINQKRQEIILAQQQGKITPEQAQAFLDQTVQRVRAQAAIMAQQSSGQIVSTPVTQGYPIFQPNNLMANNMRGRGRGTGNVYMLPMQVAAAAGRGMIVPGQLGRGLVAMRGRGAGMLNSVSLPPGVNLQPRNMGATMTAQVNPNTNIPQGGGEG